MGSTHQVTVDGRGRLVVPAELRARAGLVKGRPLVLVETEHGIVMLTQEQLTLVVREDLGGDNLVGELLAGRRRDAASDDAA